MAGVLLKDLEFPRGGVVKVTIYPTGHALVERSGQEEVEEVMAVELPDEKEIKND